MKNNNHYAIVDVETTGGNINDERITEIAIYRYDGSDIVDKFVSLVNPERKIQEFVVTLTGITDEMVLRAPKFQEIAKRVVEITDNCILVAHNSDFDYRIIRKEFSRLGYEFHKNTLCTVQLSKKLIPDMPSYSLGKLCKSLGIVVANRHRAEGDAFATVKLFELLLQKDEEKNIISSSIINFNYVLKKERLNHVIYKTPQSCGVFYLHQQNGRIMYIGKGKNMKSRLSQFLAKKSKKVQILLTKMSDVSYDETGNYLMARLKFNQEVEKHQPKYNSDFIRTNFEITFEHPDMLVIGEGRSVYEKSIILVENDSLVGYGFINLDYQKTNIEILKKILNPLTNSKQNRHIVNQSIYKERISKIVKL